jgi:hypothetical protein
MFYSFKRSTLFFGGLNVNNRYCSTLNFMYLASPFFLLFQVCESVTRGQFHQHFMSAFAPVFLCRKKFKPKMLEKMLHARTFVRKSRP